MKLQELSFTGNRDARIQPLWKLVWWFLIKISILLPHDPAIVLLKELKNPNKNLHMYFIAALLIISKI